MGEKPRPHKSPVFCANCGGMGHVYKTCNHPVISYGIICFKNFYDAKTNSIYPKYLMVQRRDSLSYVEFIRGKYELNNRKYIMHLFSKMTPGEREKLGSCTFEDIWSGMWCKSASDIAHHMSNENNSRNGSKEWREAARKFAALKKGYNVLTNEGETQFFDINWLLENTATQYHETEWGFPKGRRNINEDDMTCALREFREETGMPITRIRVSRDMKPIEEVFTGSNNVRYKHVYYVAKYTPPMCKKPNRTHFYQQQESMQLYDPCNIQQAKEVRDVQWFTYQEAQDRIRDTNVERKELFKRLNQFLIKSLVHY